MKCSWIHKPALNHWIFWSFQHKAHIASNVETRKLEKLAKCIPKVPQMNSIIQSIILYLSYTIKSNSIEKTMICSIILRLKTDYKMWHRQYSIITTIFKQSNACFIIKVAFKSNFAFENAFEYIFFSNFATPKTHHYLKLVVILWNIANVEDEKKMCSVISQTKAMLQNWIWSNSTLLQLLKNWRKKAIIIDSYFQEWASGLIYVLETL